MKIVGDALDKVLDKASSVVEKARESEYQDLIQEAKKRKNFLSTVITLLLVFTVTCVIAIAILVALLVNSPTKSAYKELQADRDQLRLDYNEAQKFIRDMVPISEREKARTEKAVEVATTVKEKVEEVAEKVDKVNPYVETTNEVYEKKIKPRAQ